MPMHEVRQGECLSSIARSYGFRDFRRIYDHPRNAEFRRLRPNPNVIFPGDPLFIPEKQEKVETRATGSTHRFQLAFKPTLLRVVLKDPEDRPYANKKYELSVGERSFSGRTSGAGLIQHPVPEDAGSGELTLWPDDQDPETVLVWRLAVGHLDPVTEPTGAQARLNNLGYHCGEVDGIVGPRTRAALLAFQRATGLSATGAVNSATEAKLREVHGC